MTGNLLLLAIETQAWMVDEMLLTIFLILAYVLSGAAYDILCILLLDDQHRGVLRYLIPTTILLGLLADCLQYSSGGCPTKDHCSGKYLYFLIPISSMTGLHAAGYWTAHPDGLTSNMMTGHMRSAPYAIIRSLMAKGDPTNQLLMQNGQSSALIITTFFSGVIAGAYTKDRLLMRYEQGWFSPVFTCFGCVMAALCCLHRNFCQAFFEHHREKSMREIYHMMEAVGMRDKGLRDLDYRPTVATQQASEHFRLYKETKRATEVAAISMVS